MSYQSAQCRVHPAKKFKVGQTQVDHAKSSILVYLVKKRRFTWQVYGENHPRAKITDHEVALLRKLRREDRVHWTFQRLADTFEICETQARNIVHRRQRL